MLKRTRLSTTVLLLVSAVAVSSCASKERISLPIPPAADLKSSEEPRFPAAALEETPAGKAAEQTFNDDTLAWGRSLKLQVDRLCRWWVNAGGKLPFRCPAAP